jgi:basic membrane protein A
MKKFVSFLLAISLIASFALTGCGSNNNAGGSDSDDNSGAANKDTVVGFIYIGPVGDGGWSYSHDQGRLYLEEKLGVKTLYKEAVPETNDVKQEIRNMIDQGAKVIFATSFGYMNYVEEISKEYPEVKFFHCSGYKTTDNMANYFGRIYEARYLSGIVAGLKTKSNKIGYVAAFPIPEVIRGINAFTLGVQSVNSDATVEVVWTSTWYNPADEKAAATALLDNGADIIAQHQDTAGPQQAAQEKNAWSIGYHTDMKEMAPKSYMTAPVWNWGPYYVEQVQSVIDGNFAPNSYWGGLNDGVVSLAPLTENAPAEAQEIVTASETKIKDGTLNIFAGPLYDQDGTEKVAEGTTMTDKELSEFNWFVQGVKGQIPEQK